MTPLLALTLSLVAGLATSLGGLVSVLGRGTSRRFLAGALGFSAGVMLCVSVVELIPESAKDLAHDGRSPWWAGVAVLVGALVVLAFSRLVHSRTRHRAESPIAGKASRGADAQRPQPSAAGPASSPAVDDSPSDAGASSEGGNALSDSQRRLLLRTGMLTALAITVHNFPEGFATFVAALSDPRAALPVVAAIALHNIPEGIAVAVPVYHATGSRMRALLLSTASGLAEPAGALLGWMLLAPFLTPAVMSGVLAGVAGVMIMICAKELIPAAFAQAHRRTAVLGMLAGALVMQISLMLLG
ncbi:zinc transporter ZupT [Brevibacterium album]|uniref:zinc transporter ZupT n=1 Tax=Brevibacterium album TaxID=417948 RepID=UPI00040C7604|nr:zinc transporter ZupT [Brevibacterium album]